ncbi:hypothetical protein JX266_014089 [Neoarthrinium moseri]|nr:hypothetical protein JX266_014089 [Neoarthrinium moseri]
MENFLYFDIMNILFVTAILAFGSVVIPIVKIISFHCEGALKRLKSLPRFILQQASLWSNVVDKTREYRDTYQIYSTPEKESRGHLPILDKKPLSDNLIIIGHHLRDCEGPVTAYKISSKNELPDVIEDIRTQERKTGKKARFTITCS